MTGDTKTVNLETIRGWLRGGFHDLMRMEVVGYEEVEQSLTMSLPFLPEYSRLPEVGDYHGGVLAAFLDVVGTFTAALAASRIVTTVNFRTDYLRAPVKVDLLATGTVVRAGRTLITCDVAIADASGKTYAIGRGTWTPVRGSGG